MVKKKVVMKICTMVDEKHRAKAHKIVAGTCGVTSTTLEKEQITVVGDGIDTAKMVKKLRRKMKIVQLVRVETIEEKKEPEQKKETKKGSEQPPPPTSLYYPPPYVYQYDVDDGNPACCIIM